MMGLIQVDKRAVTAEEGKVALALLRQQPVVFGIPTFNLSFAQYYDYCKALQERLKDETNPEKLIFPQALVQAFHGLQAADPYQRLSPDERNFILSHVAHKFYQTSLEFEPEKNKAAYDFALVAPREKFKYFAHTYSPAEYRNPWGNVIVFNGVDARFNQAIENNDPLITAAGNYYVYTHEAAHGTGAGEAQADLMAAVALRKVFENYDFLIKFADKRAFDSVLKHSKKLRPTYGWGTVDVNDAVAASEEKRILGLTEAQIRALRFKRFDPMVSNVAHVKVMLDASRHTYRDLSLEAVEHYVKEWDCGDNAELRYVADRFALACKRMAYPERFQAYKNIKIEPPDGKYPSFSSDFEI